MHEKNREDDIELEKLNNILNSSFNSERNSIGENTNIKLFNKYLEDFHKNSNEIEENGTNYYKLILQKEE